MKARQCYFVYHSMTEMCYDRTARSIRVPAAARSLFYFRDVPLVGKKDNVFPVHLSQDAGRDVL